MADVLIVLASKSDKEVGDKARDLLRQFGVSYEARIASAHRTPAHLKEIIEKTPAKVIIAIAGLSAALPGAIAAHTTKPVIGVPVSGKINLDALLSVVQMPPGIPVAAVGLDRGENAALLAVEILALSDPELGKKLQEHRRKLEEWVLEDNKAIAKE
jgi:5-(carboxyamino)imidazole ribonucleotide mutase